MYPSARRYVQKFSTFNSILAPQRVSLQPHGAVRSVTHNNLAAEMPSGHVDRSLTLRVLQRVVSVECVAVGVTFCGHSDCVALSETVCGLDTADVCGSGCNILWTQRLCGFE